MKILAVHGLGENRAGFSDKLRTRIQGAHPDVIWDELLWSDSFIDQVKWFVNTMSHDNSLTKRLADFFYYMHPKLGHTVRMDFWKAAIDADIVIGYSAGSVVAYDALTRFAGSTSPNNRVPEPKVALVTMGSPLAFYVASTGNLQEPNALYWMNIYDKRDGLSSSLGEVFNSEKFIVDDVPVHTGGIFTPHLNYWGSKNVAEQVETVMCFAEHLLTHNTHHNC